MYVTTANTYFSPAYGFPMDFPWRQEADKK
jgi:hypothetical protein